jgi:hypothetical protein
MFLFVVSIVVFCYLKYYALFCALSKCKDLDAIQIEAEWQLGLKYGVSKKDKRGVTTCSYLEIDDANNGRQLNHNKTISSSRQADETNLSLEFEGCLF